MAAVYDSAFFGCNNLVSVTIPDTVTIVGTGIFANCRKLKDVTIGRGLILVDNDAFDFCDSLTDIKVFANESDVDVVFPETNDYTRLAVYVPNLRVNVTVRGRYFKVLPFNTDINRDVMVALYKDGRLVEMQRKNFSGSELTFITNSQYTDAKVMMWDKLAKCMPQCEAEIIKKAV